MRILAAITAAALLAGLAPLAAAQPQQAAPAKAPSRKVVVAPLTSLAEGGPDLTPIVQLVGTGVATVPNVTLVPDKELRAALKKAKRKELESCDDDACLAQLGQLVGAEVVIAGEVGELGDGQVAYLKTVDVATTKEIGSTTAVLSGNADARSAEARAAAFRLLAPAAYVGTLALAIDAPGALVYVDGRQVGKSPAAPISLSVGTHALRVTHEQYRDFVRFVDIQFDKTTKLDVPLAQYPIVKDQMIEHPKQPKPTGPVKPRPWYRKGWAVGGMAGAALVGTAIVVVLLSGGVSSDKEVTVGGN
jgi:hypothetical protein